VYSSQSFGETFSLPVFSLSELLNTVLRLSVPHTLSFKANNPVNRNGVALIATDRTTYVSLKNSYYFTVIPASPRRTLFLNILVTYYVLVTDNRITHPHRR
jgi:hypothetical protein